ncbi:porin family protein [Vibrio metschnikovii]|uniref:hypothetical protein n=1 Tax=Vibrio metschnikovii TaxID=28172 RepID=UPI00164A906B|nr:hypothetical protein [Vibrio metschnikovii]MBC5830887.1 hypothetical protein [Vibrio metschnikovii]
MNHQSYAFSVGHDWTIISIDAYADYRDTSLKESYGFGGLVKLNYPIDDQWRLFYGLGYDYSNYNSGFQSQVGVEYKVNQIFSVYLSGQLLNLNEESRDDNYRKSVGLGFKYYPFNRSSSNKDDLLKTTYSYQSVDEHSNSENNVDALEEISDDTLNYVEEFGEVKNIDNNHYPELLIESDELSYIDNNEFAYQYAAFPLTDTPKNKQWLSLLNQKFSNKLWVSKVRSGSYINWVNLITPCESSMPCLGDDALLSFFKEYKPFKIILHNSIESDFMTLQEFIDKH